MNSAPGRERHFQQTLAAPFTFQGLGLHTGEPTRITAHPADVNNGRRFLRGGITIPGQAEYVSDTLRCTTLTNRGVSVSTVEHILSALFAFNVDNVVIEVDGPSHDIRVEEDKKRDEYLKTQGFEMMRFSNQDVRKAFIITH